MRGWITLTSHKLKKEKQIGNNMHKPLFALNKDSKCFTQKELETLEEIVFLQAKLKSKYGEVDCMSFVQLSLRAMHYPARRLERPPFLSCENDISIENHLRIQWNKNGETWIYQEWEKSLKNCKFLERHYDISGRVGMIGKTGAHTIYETGSKYEVTIPQITEAYLYDKCKNIWKWYIVKDIESLAKCKINLKPWHLPICGLIDAKGYLISRISNGLIRVPGTFIEKVWKPIT